MKDKLKKIFGNKKIVIGLIILLGLILVAFTAFGSNEYGHFVKAGELNQPRTHHTATLLPDGNVAVIGGDWKFKPLKSIEIYSTKEGEFVDGGELNIARKRHSSVLLPSGEILVLGGRNNTTVVRKLKNLTYKNVDKITIPDKKNGGTITLVTPKEGKEKVEVINEPSTPDIELYNPKTRTSKIVGKLKQKCFFNSKATLLPNGNVFIYCSQNPHAEIFNPKTMTSKLTSKINYARKGFSLTKLKDGKVLITGGLVSPTWDGTLNHKLKPYTLKNQAGKVLKFDGGKTTSDAEIYNPETNKFTLIGVMNYRRSSHLSMLMPDGQVLVAGGSRAWREGPRLDKKVYDMNILTSVKKNREYALLQGCIQDMELFNPKTNEFKIVGRMNYTIWPHQLILLNNRYILATGGLGKTEEIIDIKDFKTYPTGKMIYKRSGTASNIDGNKVLIVGGPFYKNTKKNTAEIFKLDK